MDVPYDMRLYTTQVLLVLASSPIPWTGDNGFHLLGYSLGGGIAVSFARYFPRMVRSLTLVAGGGLIRPHHVGRSSRVLYSSGWLPEALLQWLVKRRLTPKQQPPTEQTVAAEVTQTADAAARLQNSDASGGRSFDDAVLLSGTTVASVMAWQLRHHRGFVPAFMSTIRHAPIYGQQAEWRRLGLLLAQRRPPGEDSRPPPPGLIRGRVLLVLGALDSVILEDEVRQDVEETLGREAFAAVVLECGHEIAIARGRDVAAAAVAFWRECHASY